MRTGVNIRRGRSRSAALLSCVVVVLGILPLGLRDPFAPSASASDISDIDRHVSFDGVRQWGRAVSTSFDIVNDVSLSAWVRPDAVSCATECVVVAKDQGFGIYISASEWWYQFHNGSAWTKVDTDVTARAGEWVHVAMTRVKSSGVATFYVNGDAMKTSTYTSTLGTGSDNVDVGAWAAASTTSTASLPFDGDIDEVRLWNVVRTQAQIRADMTTWGPADATGLVGYWDFNESSTSVVRNVATSGSSGTEMTLVNRPTKTDVKTVTTSGSNTVVSFARSYLTAAGGWRAPNGVSSRRLGFTTAGSTSEMGSLANVSSSRLKSIGGSRATRWSSREAGGCAAAIPTSTITIGIAAAHDRDDALGVRWITDRLLPDDGGQVVPGRTCRGNRKSGHDAAPACR